MQGTMKMQRQAAAGARSRSALRVSASAQTQVKPARVAIKEQGQYSVKGTVRKINEDRASVQVTNEPAPLFQLNSAILCPLLAVTVTEHWQCSNVLTATSPDSDSLAQGGPHSRPPHPASLYTLYPLLPCRAARPAGSQERRLALQASTMVSREHRYSCYYSLRRCCAEARLFRRLSGVFFAGHGGIATADWLEKNLMSYVNDNWVASSPENSMTEAFLSADSKLLSAKTVSGVACPILSCAILQQVLSRVVAACQLACQLDKQTGTRTET